MMTQLNYPLSILARAIEFRNLSSASLHVGLSQPQLSRLVAKLERELGMELLDRRVKRKSSWTPNAMKLADVFRNSERRLDHSVRALQTGQRLKQIHIGTLEGLAATAITFGKRLFDEAALELVMLDVYDRNELEAKFLAGDLDLIINTRLPSPAKPRYLRVCGYQSLDVVEKNPEFSLFSTFEYNIRPIRQRRTDHNKTMVSNSLFVRRTWLDLYGGHGTIPSDLYEKQKKGCDEVYLIGGDWLDAYIWNLLK